MGFIKAIQHVTIGYGIRRSGWGKEAVISLGFDGQTLLWHTGEKVILCGLSKDPRSVEDVDIKATDWETI